MLESCTLSEISLLGANLQEVYAARLSANLYQDLVPSPYNNRLYFKSSWQGRILTFFYCCLKRHDETWKIRSINQIMEKTHEIYQRCAAKAHLLTDQIQNSFQEKIEGRTINESALNSLKRSLTTWHNATSKFLKQRNKFSDNFQEFLSSSCLSHDVEGEGPLKKPFDTLKQDKRSRLYQKIIDFEALLEHPLPLSILYKASTAAPLSQKENEILSKFSKKINKASTTIDVASLFNKFLRAMTMSFQHLQKGSLQPSLMNLCSALLKHRCRLFAKADPRHLDWREKSPGDVLKGLKMPITLRERLKSSKESKDDIHVFYTIENDPSHLAVFGINRLVLPMESHDREEMSYALLLPSITEVEEKGRFALVEKLITPLKKYKWESCEDITPRDFEHIAPVVCTFKWCIAQNATPKNFSDLIYDENGELKCTKQILCDPFSYIMLEDYAWQISQGNPFIFKYLMTKSGLLDHDDATFFKEVIRAVCSGQDIDISILSQVKGITDYRLVDRAKELKRSLNLKLGNCIVLIRQTHKDAPRLQAKVSSAFHSLYIESCALSRIPEIENLVVDRIKNQLENEKSL